MKSLKLVAQNAFCTVQCVHCLRDVSNVIVFHQLPVRAPVELLKQVHLVKVQVDMIAPVMRLMTVPTHMSVEVKYDHIILTIKSFLTEVQLPVVLAGVVVY